MSTTTIVPPTGMRMWLLAPRLRRAVLVVHILAAAAWIGVDVVVAVLVVAGRVSEQPASQGVAYLALGRFVVGPMLTAGLLRPGMAHVS